MFPKSRSDCDLESNSDDDDDFRYSWIRWLTPYTCIRFFWHECFIHVKRTFFLLYMVAYNVFTTILLLQDEINGWQRSISTMKVCGCLIFHSKGFEWIFFWQAKKQFKTKIQYNFFLSLQTLYLMMRMMWLCFESHVFNEYRPHQFLLNQS